MEPHRKKKLYLQEYVFYPCTILPQTPPKFLKCKTSRKPVLEYGDLVLFSMGTNYAKQQIQMILTKFIMVSMKLYYFKYL